MTDQGYRTVPHTADVRVEAWGGSCWDCISAALRGLVSTFADVSGARPVRVVRRRLDPSSPADLLAAAADEIIYILDTRGEIPLSVLVQPDGPPDVKPDRATGTGSLLVLELTSIDAVEFTGAIPKAVSLYELACEPDATGGWWASMTVDV